jgi:uncharacterized protein YegP (UPF0339 family)
MATATKKVHTASTAAAPAARVSEPASLEFLTSRDNGGNYHWEIVNSGGETLAHSDCFASQEDAERAARHVYERVSSARFEQHASKERETVPV